nr:MAG TPA: hypothetical protein [Caudoviricetes sp.]
MNKQRRAAIAKVIEKINQNKDELQSILDDEEFAFDNLSEGLQATEMGQTMEEAIDVLGEAIEGLDEVTGNLYDLTI